MIIQDSLTIKEVQNTFHEKYPGLKIEFYQNKHEDHEGSSKAEQHDPSKKIFELRSTHGEGDLPLKGELTVQEVETMFEELFGLHVQVFRRSNNLWLQTTKTDHWTLAEQNGKGLRSKVGS